MQDAISDILNDLIKSLKPLLSNTVKHAYLLIFPDESGRHETDIRINFSLENSNGRFSDFTFGNEPDGQTPLIISGKLCPHYKFSELPQREIEWSKSEFWKHIENLDYEVFEIDPTSDLYGIIDRNILDIIILLFGNGNKKPTGIIFIFDGGPSVYSLPGATKNTISLEIHEDYFPEPIEYFSVKHLSVL